MVHYPYAHSIYFTDSLLITLLIKDFFTYFVIRVIGNSAYPVWTGRVTKTGTVVCATNRLRIVLIGTSIPVFVPKNIFYRINLVVTKNHRLQIHRNPYIRWRIYRHHQHRRTSYRIYTKTRYTAISEPGPDEGPVVNPKTVIHADPYLRQ